MWHYWSWAHLSRSAAPSDLYVSQTILTSSMKGPDASSQAGAPQRKEVLDKEGPPTTMMANLSACPPTLQHCKPKHLSSHTTAPSTPILGICCRGYQAGQGLVSPSSPPQLPCTLLLYFITPLSSWSFPKLSTCQPLCSPPPQQLLQLCFCSTRTTPIPNWTTPICVWSAKLPDKWHTQGTFQSLLCWTRWLAFPE